MVIHSARPQAAGTTQNNPLTTTGPKNPDPSNLIQHLPACPIPEIARLGRTLRKWKDAFLAYFDTDGASNGPTEAINGIIELGRRTARGYRNPTNYQLRMLLIAGGLDASTHTQL